MPSTDGQAPGPAVRSIAYSARHEDEGGGTVAGEIDRTLFDKAIEMTATALRGGMGGQGSQPPAYAGELFREIWRALKEGAEELPERPRAGF
jgi:hypothetical protein